ncbi:transcription initiation factor TFIID subunit 2 [Phoenix dactylifera]|uniref:Transcription initiation factor TFIID subunit 2 n=1 Tax=Phoenix dactylifera TaxID=42345 RepID=A0A8B8ZSY0_PHODC|nr:transcription initiation factor TFIID subunit 2 [Phoenix dactylifera]
MKKETHPRALLPLWVKTSRSPAYTSCSSVGSRKKMAKPRKQKNEEQKPESSGGVVLHQKLCLSIDMEERRICGYTELKLVVPESGYVALYADNMNIKSVTVDGELAEFEYSPHYQIVEDEKRFCSVSCPKSAADIACSIYSSSLDREMVPNLLITCHRSAKSINEQQDQENGRNLVQKSSGEQVANGYNGHPVDKNVKLVRIDYWVKRAETGIHFMDNLLHTNNQIRRAHCWFPCKDSILQRCSFDLEFTVNSNFVAVSNGNLLYQVLTNDDPPRKTYVYKLSTPVSAGWISLAVAPFEILPDIHNGIISHMCLSPNFLKLQNTVGFFHSAFSYYEDYLSTSFPFGSYKQIFIPPEMTITSMSLGASMCIFSSHLLFDDKVIDQTIDTRIKLAYALARQWFGVYITAEEPNDEWLLDGLAGFLTDTFIKRFLGNNEARYQRYKANCAVCKVDVTSATALSSPAASSDLYGTQTIGLYGKIRTWKATAVLQMLEKQMGPDSFRKILQHIVCRARDSTRYMRMLSTKEFRHLANKVGNLERPFLKEFFPRWVESCGCPVMRMGLSYNKRRNMIELAVMRGCTEKTRCVSGGNPDSEIREGETGWPGMMSIRVHELDGMYDHPVLPMAGESWQLLEIQCHSKLAAKRFQKQKKGSKPDGSDDNVDAVSTQDMRTGMDSPLLWIRVDPEMEYLAEIHFHQPVQMWINQLEKDKDVVAQSQAISMLQKLPQLSFSVVNALNSFLNDSKAFWRVRIEAAYALAYTASEETDLAGLLYLIKFYKSRRFDADIGLPRPNDFHDVPEYFVLEAIPHAVSLVRAADKKSPREAIEFVLQLLKYNDNNGNPYSDVYWLAALVQSIGELEFGQQGVLLLSSLLKHIDRLLQFDSLMPSYNGILTISCIRTLAQIALKMSTSIPLDRIRELIKPFRNIMITSWKVRMEASKILLDLEFYCKGLDAALCLFMKFLEEEPSFRGQVKLAMHVMHLCQVNVESQIDNDIGCPTLVALLHLLASRKAFNNVFLRHHLFCILQVVAGRCPTLYGVPKIKVHPVVAAETCTEQLLRPGSLKLKISRPQEPLMDTNLSDALPITESAKDAEPVSNVLPIAETAKETDTVSNCSERKNVVKIRVKQPASSSKADDVDRQMDHSRGAPNEAELGPCSSVSVDAPTRGANEPLNVRNRNNEEVNSSHDHESRMTASIGSAKLVSKDEIGKELQCTADSRLDVLSKDQLSPVINVSDGEAVAHKTSSLQTFSIGRHDGDGTLLPMDDQEAKEKRKKDKKDKEKKRKREDKANKKDDPEYLERKRLKKEKKRMEKESAKIQKGEERTLRGLQNAAKPVESQVALAIGESKKADQSVDRHVSKSRETTSDNAQSSSAPKVRIKIKSRVLETSNH